MEKKFKNIDDNLLLRYILGEVSVDEKKSVDEWKSFDPKNAQYFFRFKEIVQKQENYNFYNQINLNDKWNQLGLLKEKRSSRKIYLNVLKIAASIIIIFSIGYLVKKPVLNNLSTNSITYLAETDNDMFYLPDSSSVILHKGSKITYPTKFNRQVSLVGNGFFNIKKDTTNPFVVKLPDSEIKVLGTSFEVLNNDSLIISLYTGKILFSNKTSEHILNPGQRIVGNKNNDTKIDKFSDSSLSLRFEAAPLKTVCEKMEKVYLYKFSVAEGLENLQVTGDFTGVSIHDFLNSLSFLFDIKSNITERYIVLSKLNS